MNSNNNGIGGRSIRVQKPRHSETMPGAAVPVLGIRVRDASLSVRWRHPPFPFCSCFPTPLFTLSLLPLPPPPQTNMNATREPNWVQNETDLSLTCLPPAARSIDALVCPIPSQPMPTSFSPRVAAISDSGVDAANNKRRPL